VVQTFARLFPPAPLNQSAESAIGFGGRLQRHHCTGLCNSGVVFDPHRPYQPNRLNPLMFLDRVFPCTPRVPRPQ
jgi:hypothetical protein